MKIQIDDTVRDMTPEEIATLEQQRAAADAAAAEHAAQVEAARAKLLALGLDESDIDVLIRN